MKFRPNTRKRRLKKDRGINKKEDGQSIKNCLMKNLKDFKKKNAKKMKLFIKEDRKTNSDSISIISEMQMKWKKNKQRERLPKNCQDKSAVRNQTQKSFRQKYIVNGTEKKLKTIAKRKEDKKCKDSEQT